MGVCGLGVNGGVWVNVCGGVGGEWVCVGQCVCEGRGEWVCGVWVNGCVWVTGCVGWG